MMGVDWGLFFEIFSLLEKLLSLIFKKIFL
jgi:hypothetical protein